MHQHIKHLLIVIVTVGVTSLIWSSQVNKSEPGNQAAATTPEGSATPNLTGIWQAVNTGYWDIEPHNARPGKIVELGALGAIPAGLGIVEGGIIPYKEEALVRRNDNREHWLERDPLVKCYMPGIPRANYLPFPFHIVQSDNHIIFSYEFASASRTVYMNQPEFTALGESWMGHSLGRWEDGSLVITVTDQVADTWFDSAGNFHSDKLKVVEKFTPEGDNLIWYEAEITDPEVFTRSWKIRFPLYRRVEPNMQLLEFKCVEFVEDLLYGDLVVPTPPFDWEETE